MEFFLLLIRMKKHEMKQKIATAATQKILFLPSRSSRCLDLTEWSILMMYGKQLCRSGAFLCVAPDVRMSKLPG